MRLNQLFVILIATCAFHSVSGQVQIEKPKCGVQRSSIQSRIFGGEKLEKDEFKFSWLVGFYQKSAKTYFCAGSLISAKHVLSGKTRCFI